MEGIRWFHLAAVGRKVLFHEKANGCWIWVNGCKNGRPVVWRGRQAVFLARAVWAQVTGKEPKGFLQRTCDERRCCFPGHRRLARSGSEGRERGRPPRTHWFGTNAKGCWLWTGGQQTYGYGWVSLKGKKVLTHRRSWELYNGPVPKGLVVRHDCDNPPCCRPDHLRIGTQRDNALDAVERTWRPHRLTWAQVDQIKHLAERKMSLRRIAQTFGVTHKTISRICRGATYQGDRPRRILAVPTTPCWEWEGRSRPYGQFKENGKMILAHRRAWEVTYGPLPPAAVVMHRCDNKLCIRPDHLEIGTRQDNVDDWNGKLMGTHRLAWHQIDEIRRLRTEEGLSYKKIGKLFHINDASVLRICRNEIYIKPDNQPPCPAPLRLFA